VSWWCYSFYRGFTGYLFYGWFIAKCAACFETLGMSFLIISIIIVLNLNVYSLLTLVALRFKCLQQ
jgi:hypothetical protein